jgi:hypothetical protein
VSGSRPAFYALRPAGWRDYVTLLHPPYTAWHLSYVAVGAALAPEWRPERLGWTLVAFALALGVGAHALDELNGRPLRTRIPSAVLVGLAVASIAGAAAIGVVAAVRWTPWLLVFVAAGVFLVAAYNLELARGFFHTDLWFALAWGAFPLLTAYVACAERLRAEAVVAAAFAALLSAAQRTLSRPARELRRHVVALSGTVELDDGTSRPLDAEALRAPLERALLALAVSAVALATALVLFRAL